LVCLLVRKDKKKNKVFKSIVLKVWKV